MRKIVVCDQYAGQPGSAELRRGGRRGESAPFCVSAAPTRQIEVSYVGPGRAAQRVKEQRVSVGQAEAPAGENDQQEQRPEARDRQCHDSILGSRETGVHTNQSLAVYKYDNVPTP